MGMYSFRIPGNFDMDYEKLIPGGEYKKAINLAAIGSAANMLTWSIQASASAPVAVKAWISNYLYPPFNQFTEQRNWTPPAQTTGIGGLWVPCTSIKNFTVNPGTNYFQQGEWNDTAQYLLLQLSPGFPIGSTKKKDTVGNPVEVVAFSLAITFR